MSTYSPFKIRNLVLLLIFLVYLFSEYFMEAGIEFHDNFNSLQQLLISWRLIQLSLDYIHYLQLGWTWKTSVSLTLSQLLIPLSFPENYFTFSILMLSYWKKLLWVLTVHVLSSHESLHAPQAIHSSKWRTTQLT